MAEQRERKCRNDRETTKKFLFICETDMMHLQNVSTIKFPLYHPLVYLPISVCFYPLFHLNYQFFVFFLTHLFLSFSLSVSLLFPEHISPFFCVFLLLYLFCLFLCLNYQSVSPFSFLRPQFSLFCCLYHSIYPSH